ncbi:hypothetical protein LshimejAT787_0601610 [Lyophyllum shimeji]|uniref:Uncharacterized protein n=1 Tax=Lyophyllum shimeji TaxID=47721 RepID=A0A9P3PP81_LYOSH|nr:hypothetical protein LshimejAT787_0601610 [Lyophyllum shimeji]
MTRICAPPAHVFPLLAGGNERALPSLHSLELVLPLELYFLKTYKSILSQVVVALEANLRTDSIMPSLIVNFDTEFLWSPIEDCMRYTLDEYLMTAVGSKTVFELPEEMVITGFSSARFSSEVVFVLLPRWLGLFKGLKYLTFSSMGVKPPIYAPARIIRAIHKHCPYIETVTIKGTRHDVTRLLKEKGPILAAAGQNKKLADDVCNFGEHSVSITVQREKKGALEVLTDLSSLRPRSAAQPIEHISCRLPSAPCHRFIIYEFFQQFHQVILSLPSVNSVTLDLTGASFIPLTVKSASETCRIHWTVLVISLLQAICARSCTTLTVHGGAFLSELTLPPPPPPPLLPSADDDGNDSDDGNDHRSRPQRPQPPWYPLPPPPSQTTAHLERLELDSVALSTSPIRYWLYHSIQEQPSGKPLSHLLISHTPSRPTPALTLEVPALAHAVFSDLTALTLACPAPRATSTLTLTTTTLNPHADPNAALPLPAYIPAILHALPQLTTLELDGTCPAQPIAARPPTMARLKQLAAPAEYIAWLLPEGGGTGAGAGEWGRR